MTATVSLVAAAAVAWCGFCAGSGGAATAAAGASSGVATAALLALAITTGYDWVGGTAAVACFALEIQSLDALRPAGP